MSLAPEGKMGHWILGDLFLKDFGHQNSIKTLWETRWKFPCKLGVYPFHDGKFEDFEPIFNTLIEKNINDPYDDAWPNSFTPTAEKLASEASTAENADRAKAIELYKRAACVLRLARMPYLNWTPAKLECYKRQKEIYMKGAALWDVPMQDISIPFVDGKENEGKEVPLYVRTPMSASKQSPVPVLFLISGLDGHRPDNWERSEEAIKRGWAIVITDIPGVADCPTDKRDPEGADRLMTTILNWIHKQPQFDSKRVAAWGLSAGGYHAIRAAHTHKDYLAGSVGHGAGTHHYIGAEWLEHVHHHEYPFSLKEAYLGRYGYKDWDDLVANCQKDHSLVLNKIVEKPSCRLFLMNGMLDGCMPVEDSMLLMEFGTPKEARLIQGRAHMGYPEANSHVWPWLESVVASVK